MANTCMNTIYIHGNEEDIRRLTDLLNTLSSERLALHRLGSMMGLSQEAMPPCRGEITYYDTWGSDVIEIEAETAWAPTHEFWEHGLKNLFKHPFTYNCLAIETGCGICEAYGKESYDFIVEDYVVDSCVDSLSTDETALPFADTGITVYEEQDIRNELQDFLKTKESDIEILTDKYNQWLDRNAFEGQEIHVYPLERVESY